MQLRFPFGPPWPLDGAWGWLPSPCTATASPCLGWRKRELTYPRLPQRASQRDELPSLRLGDTPSLRTSQPHAQETLGQGCW